MVKSMTGYGRAQLSAEGYNITVELKSVNHRYFEFNCRTPRGFAFLEDKLKNYVSSRVGRGKVDFYLQMESVGVSNESVDINREYTDGYVSALRRLSKIYGVPYDVTVSTLARNSEIFKVQKNDLDEEKITSVVLEVAAVAVDKFIESRTSEGARMAADIKEKAMTVIALTEEVEKLSAVSVNNYRANLEEKIREILGNTAIDEQRLLTETAIFADKVAVDEETVRLKSHVNELCRLLTLDEPVGRKLDFIVQEMNREANTTGSKSQDIVITRNVVDMKSNIEKIREQVQNIE